MKTGRALLLLGAWLLLGPAAAQAGQPVSKEAALKAIEVFQGDPSSAEGFAAASTILSFVRHSDLAQVSLSKAVIPWVKGADEPDADTRGMLLTAYLAGNVRAQLAAGKAKDDPYAGWQQVFATYDQLHRINPTVKLSEVEKLKEKEKAGKLRAYAAEVLRKN